MKIQTFMIASAIVALSAGQSFAARQVFLDGATYGLSTQGPYNFNGTPYGRLSFWSGPNGGQLNDGYVTIWQVQYPFNQPDSSLEVRLENPNPNAPGGSTRGRRCPDILADINNYGWGGLPESEQDQWTEDECQDVPDPTMYNSGNRMGLTFYVTSDDNYTHWAWATFDNAIPQDWGEYNIQIFFSTGDGIWGSWAALLVTPKWGGTPQWFWPSWSHSDGTPFHVQIEDQYYAFGCQGSDSRYADTCYRGGLGELYLYMTEYENEIIPYGTNIGKTLTSFGTAEDLGIYGQIPYGYPPTVYLTGDDSTFIVNAADEGFGVTTPQQYTIYGWWNSYNPVVGNLLGGTLFADWQDPF